MMSSASNGCENMNDTDLTLLLGKSHEGAFSEIYNRYWLRLFSIAFNKLNNLPEAEELVQDIFLDLWSRRETLKITSSLAAYLAVAAKYKVLDCYAKRATRLRYQKHLSYSSDSLDSSTENWLYHEELKENFRKSVASLPDKCRLVFELSRNNGLTHKQIATKLEIAEKTVESHLSRALRTLRMNLGSFLSFFLPLAVVKTLTFIFFRF